MALPHPPMSSCRAKDSSTVMVWPAETMFHHCPMSRTTHCIAISKRKGLEKFYFMIYIFLASLIVARTGRLTTKETHTPPISYHPYTVSTNSKEGQYNLLHSLQIGHSEKLEHNWSNQFKRSAFKTIETSFSILRQRRRASCTAALISGFRCTCCSCQLYFSTVSHHNSEKILLKESLTARTALGLTGCVSTSSGIPTLCMIKLAQRSSMTELRLGIFGKRIFPGNSSL